MAVVRQGGRSITFTAQGDATPVGADLIELRGLTFRGGSGLTAGDRLLVTDEAGNILADYTIEASIDNADLSPRHRPITVKQIIVAIGPSGTWMLTAQV